MDVSMLVPPTGDHHQMAAMVADAQRCGIDAIWVPDHLYGGRNFTGRPWVTVWPALAALARTDATRIGTLVSGVPIRPAATLAATINSFAATDRGRYVCGIGAGARSDADATGTPVASPAALHTYTRRARELLHDDIRIVVAANQLRSAGVAQQTASWWVTCPHAHSWAAKLERLIELHEQTRNPAPARSLAVVDVADHNPWDSPAVFDSTLTDLEQLGYDETVIWHPSAYQR